MAAERIVFLKDAGEVLIKKRKGSRRVSIRIHPDGTVRMTVPFFVSFRDAEKFLDSRQAWVRKNLEKVTRNRADRKIYTDKNPPQTKYHEFIIATTRKPTPQVKYSQGLCEILLSADTDILSKPAQNLIRETLVETYRKEARVILIGRCRELAEKFDFSISDIRVKRLKTRWGSCSSRGNINLNIFLMALPQYLIDYVILHELVHTRYMNHSDKFWKELSKYIPEPKKKSREMKNYSGLLTEFESKAGN